MQSSLRERFARLGPIRGADRVLSGSRATFVLEIGAGDRFARRIDAMFALARRGLPLLDAKRTVEELLETCRAVVTLPTVEAAAAVVEDLRQTGVSAAVAAEHGVLARLPHAPGGRRGAGVRDQVHYTAKRGLRWPNVMPVRGHRAAASG